MADFDFSTLITDRGQSDLATLRSVLSTPMEEWTAEQLAAFNLAASKGAYNYTDLNRVTAAMDDLNERLTALGYETGYQQIVVPHQESGGSVLPEGYTQLEYIQSSGSQYINTGVSMPEGFRAVLDFKFTQASSQIQCLIGSHEQAAPYYRNYFGINANFQSWNLGCYDSYSFGTLANNTRYKVDVCNVSQKIKCVINEENQNLSQSIATNAARSSRPLYLFAMNYPDGLLPAYMRLYSCKIYSPIGELVRDFVPCTNPSGVVGLYDFVGQEFYGNAGTGSFIAGPEVAALPDGYRQVEYIESSGTQWINTGVPVEAGSGFSLDFSLVSASGNIGMIGGFDYGGYNNNFGALTGQWGAQYGNNLTYLFGTVDTNRHKVEQNVMPGLVVFDGAQVVGELIFYDNTDRTFNLFCYNGGPSYPTFWIGSMRIYSCVLYENGTVLRNYIPCINPSNEPGLYDLVHAQFYGNNGTGAFTTGIEIDPPVPDPEPSLDAYTWYEEDVPTESTMAGYLANVSALREVLTLPENTTEVPADMAGLTLAEANAIEEILLVIEDYLTALVSVFCRCGAAICGGPGFYFVN